MTQADVAPARKRIKQLDAMVADVVAETPDTTTLSLFTGNDQLEYRAGHFLTIDAHQFDPLERFIAFLEELKGKKEPARAYSLASAPGEKHLEITIKEERFTSGSTKYPPLLSPLLVRHMTRGMRLTITGFTGPYTLPDDIESKTNHLVHVCAGSGIVPNFSILKYALANHPRLRHTLIYSSKTWSDVIFRKQLDALEHTHPDRLRVVHTLTREHNGAPNNHRVQRGRITAALLAELILDPRECLVYACGPAITAWERKAAKEKGVAPGARFLEGALDVLDQIGVSPTQITHESYG